MDDDLVKALAGLFVVALAIYLAFWAAILLIPLGILIFIGWLIYYSLHGSPAALERKAREHTHALYQEVLDRYSPTDPNDFAASVIHRLPELPLTTAVQVGLVAGQIYEIEHYHAVPEPPLICNSIEGGRYRDFLSQLTAFDEERAKEILVESLLHVVVTLAHDTDGTLQALPEPDPDIILETILPFYQDKTFPDLRGILDRNLHELSGVPLHEKDSPKLIMPPDYTGENIHYAYLKDTPLIDLFDIASPFSLPEKPRYEHCHIVAGTGQGKTTLLQHLILADLKSDKSVVVIDSQGQLIPQLAHLKLDRRVIVIDPRDDPTLNVFDISYPSGQAEQVFNQTLEVFNYLFSSLIGADLTTKQQALFNYIVALTLKMPETMGRPATLRDVMDLMDNPAPYGQAIDALDDLPKRFFSEDFLTSTYTGTKEQIRYRLQAILGNKTLARLFLAPRNTVDFFEELNSGSVVLIDTSKDFLGTTNSSFMGKISIALVLNAILLRTAHRHPTMLYIDEAGEYFSDSIDQFLTEARKRMAGVTMAHQYLGQLPPHLRSSVASNTSIKFAGGLSNQDARRLASDMRTSPEFILSQPSLQFACYINNETVRSVRVPVGILDAEEQMTDEEYEAFRQTNRAFVSAPPPQEPPPEPADEIDDPTIAVSDWE